MHREVARGAQEDGGPAGKRRDPKRIVFQINGIGNGDDGRRVPGAVGARHGRTGTQHGRQI